jgi:type IV pilus assembly protein PilM
LRDGGLLHEMFGGKNSVEGFMNWDWKQLFRVEETQVLGLDIGSTSVKMVQMRKDDTGCVVTAAGIADIANGAEDNQRQREVNTVRAIRECFQSSGAQTQLAVCGVCGSEVAVRYFKFPLLPPEEVEGAVLLEAAQVCPFSIDDSAVDYQLIPNGENSICGVLVAATNKLIEKKMQLASHGSFNCVLMDVDGLALLNCFSEYEKAEAGQTTAILSVGSSYATLAIMGANALPFIRDIAYAGEAIIKEIAAEKDVSTEVVKKALFDSEGGAEIELGDSLERACQKLIVDVTETLRYYTAQEKSTTVEKIFVCDGFALARGFVELLDSHLPAKVMLWNPFDRIHCDAGQDCHDILQKKGPAMAVAAGLAMRSI